MNTILVFSALMFLNLTVSSQSSWVSLPVPMDALYDNIQFTCNDTGYIRASSEVGYKLFKTTNCGNNWLSVNLPQNFTFGNYYFLNSREGLICGNISFRAAFYKTTNSGINWTRVFLGDSTGSSFYPITRNITFADDMNGF